MSLGGFGTDSALRARQTARNRREAGSPQLPLPAPTGPLWGGTDPDTSRQAAEACLSKIGQRQAEALKLVRDNPGFTAIELGAVAARVDPSGRGPEYWRQRVGRRLAELEAAGLLERHGEASPQGRRACRWWPVREPRS